MWVISIDMPQVNYCEEKLQSNKLWHKYLLLKALKGSVIRTVLAYKTQITTDPTGKYVLGQNCRSNRFYQEESVSAGLLTDKRFGKEEL